jgi:hypothetical protein
MSDISGKDWGTILDSDDIELDQIYIRAICLLAATQATEHLEELEEKGEEIPDGLRPDISDPEETFLAVLGSNAPLWWPNSLDRLEIKIVYTSRGHTKAKIGPHSFDPNVADVGKPSFTNLMRTLLEIAGTPFDGTLQIEIMRRRDKTKLTGWRGDVYVGEKAKRKRGGSPERDDGKEEMWEYVVEESRRKDEAMQRMFANASNVIHASASGINAMRGANVAPPWMRQDGSEETPLWMVLAQSALQTVVQAGLIGQQGNQAAAQAGMQGMQQIMQHPVQSPGALNPYGDPQQPQPHQQPQLTDRSRDLGYDQYHDEGEYDGYYVAEDDLVDDDFDGDDEWYDEDDDGYTEEDDGYVDDYEEDYEEEQQGHTSPQQRRRSGNPLDDMDPDELAQHLNSYIDNNQHRRTELRNLGMGLAGKLLK